ncbi:MAG: hypothetical protein Q9184_007802, partial [Pyrenodesmia sp. 2 TL-2023]
TRDHPTAREQGGFAALPGEEPSSSAQTETAGYRNVQRGGQSVRQSLRKRLSLHWLWLIPLWLLLVPLLRPLLSVIDSTSQEMASVPTNDKLAPAFLIQTSIEAALESTHIPHTAELHALSKQAAINCHNTILSRKNYISHLHSLFAAGGNQVTTSTKSPSTLRDKAIETFLFYFSPWEITTGHQTRFALAQATYLTHHGLPALDAFSTYYSGNLSHWIQTMGQISESIAIEQESHTGELASFGTNPIAYIREVYYAHDSWEAAELSRTMGGLACRSLKILVPLVERVQETRSVMLEYRNELGETMERCVMGKKGGCDGLVRLLGRFPPLALAA